MLGLAALMGMLFIAALCALGYIASSENRRFIEHSIGDAQKALSASQELIGRALRDYAFWNDAYRYMGGRRVDIGWAYVRDNMGTSLYRTYAIEGAFIVGSRGDTRYSLLEGKLSQLPLEQYVSGDLAPLFAAARRVADSDRVSRGYYAVGGQPATVYAAVLKPTLAPAGVSNEQLSLLVYVDLIDAAHLQKWQDNYALDHLNAALTDTPGAGRMFLISRTDAGGPLRLQWDAEAPGDTLLRAALPILCLVMLCFSAIAGYFYRSAVRSAAMFDQSRHRIEHLARHDPLTGLANRAYLKQHLEQQLEQHTSVGRPLPPPLYLISLDLDLFKPINDAFGHAAGDAVLCKVAARMQALVGPTGLVARVGGDEFVLVISEPSVDIDGLCASLCASVAQPMTFDGKVLEVGVSIGVAVAPRDGALAAELLRASDIALYMAKSMGRNNWKLYDRAMDRRAQ